MLAGRCYHHCVATAATRKVLFNEIMSDEELSDVFADHWSKEMLDKLVYDELGEEKVEATVIDFGDEDPGKLKDSGIKLSQKYVNDILPKLNIEAIERRYEVDINGITFVAYPDLELVGDIIADHKFRQKRMSQDEVDRDIQATSYALVKNKPIIFQFHQALDAKEKKIEVAETRRDKGDIEWFKRLVVDIWRSIETAIFPCNPTGWWCGENSCAYWLDCKKGWF